MRRFNTAGPCRPDHHYMIPALSRLPEAPGVVAQNGYFVVHAPRQTGKTTALRALAEELTAAGRYAALYFSCEFGEAAGDDYRAAERSILQEILDRAAATLPEELRPPHGRTCTPRIRSGVRCRRGRGPARDRWRCSSTRSTRCAGRV